MVTAQRDPDRHRTWMTDRSFPGLCAGTSPPLVIHPRPVQAHQLLPTRFATTLYSSARRRPWLRRSHSATRLWLGPTAFPISQGVCRLAIRLLASRYRSYDEMNTSRIVQPSIAWAHYFRLKNPKQLALKACNYATACTEFRFGERGLREVPTARRVWQGSTAIPSTRIGNIIRGTCVEQCTPQCEHEIGTVRYGFCLALWLGMPKLEAP